ncbi:MAG TPA: hypothetical protein VFS20_09315 [Longimicrobium sp.]|nr:hypothetical protein [Longimicrobium sp.]
MQRHLVFIAAALALAASIPRHAAAQERPTTVIVGLGRFGGASLGTPPSVEGDARARLRGTTAPVLGIQAPTRIRGVDVRLTVQHARPFLALETADGVTRHDRAGVTSLTADAVINLPPIAGARPYLLAGAGLRRYDFDQGDYRDRGVAVVPRDEVEPLVHLGAGVARRVGAVDLFAEASAVGTGYISGTMGRPGRTVGDFSYTLGVRIPLGRGR